MDWRQFVAGGAGGISLTLVGQPLDTAKVKLQTAPSGTYRGMFDCMAKIWKAEGLAGFYRGVQAPLVSTTPLYAVYFWGFQQGQNMAEAWGGSLYDRKNDKITLAGLVFAGGFSAIPGTAFMVPSDRVKVMLQASSGANARFKGPVEVVSYLWRTGGIASFYKGTALTLLRDIPGSMAYYAGYEVVLEQCMKLEGTDRQRVSVASSLFSGGIAGILNWLIAVPPDTIKSRIQSAKPGQYPGGASQILKEIIRKDGLLGTYAGIGPAMIRAFPANAACFTGYELAMRGLNFIAPPRRDHD